MKFKNYLNETTGYTSSDGEKAHKHQYNVNTSTGDGEASFDDGHKHKIKNWKVLPGGKNAHTHAMREDRGMKGK